MNYYNEIKKELINNEIYKKVKDYSKNKNDLITYYNVGKLLIEAQGSEEKSEYGDKLIKDYSKRLTNELGKGYSWRNLYNMRLFYIYSKDKILQTMSAKLSWSHYIEILKFKDINKINYYINISIEDNLSVRELRNIIKSQEYERLDDTTKNKLLKKEEPNQIKDYIKHPIIIKNKHNYIEITERILKQLILEDIDNFLIELGQGFTYIRNEYKIKLGNNYNYIDILLYNIEFNCYVVLELKITELKKEHIGQIQTYMNYIDKNIKKPYQDKTIGIIIVKKDNEFIMEYCSDERIYRTTYELV